MAMAAALVAAAVATAGAQGPQVYRSATELVVLQVSVVDQQRRYVPDLRAEDFAVFEEGQRQALTLFASASAPLDLTLLLDTSASMRERMHAEQQAAVEFVRTLRPEDRASIVLVSDTARIAREPTGDLDALEAAIRGASPGGGTALYQGIYIALRELARLRRAEPMRRQALVVLTDGDDTASRLSFADALDEGRRGAVTIFSIVPWLPSDLVFEPRRPAAPYDLRQLADETGGRAFAPSHIDDLAGVYREIAEELRHQYWLAYVPAGTSAGFRKVAVRIPSRPELRARTRSGYEASCRNRIAASSRCP
jgi:VWFA-related protein